MQFSFNLSGANFNYSYFFKFVESKFAVAAIPYKSICAEITETAFKRTPVAPSPMRANAAVGQAGLPHEDNLRRPRCH